MNLKMSRVVHVNLAPFQTIGAPKPRHVRRLQYTYNIQNCQSNFDCCNGHISSIKLSMEKQSHTIHMDTDTSPTKSARDFRNCVSYLMTLKSSECNEDISDLFDDGENDKCRNNLCSDLILSELQRMCEKIPDAMPLAQPDDHIWLSELHCFLRSDCCEFFRAGKVHKTGLLKRAFSNRMSRLPISEGRVGIRCRFCGDAPYHKRAAQALSFPSQISGIYSAVCMMQVRHFPICKLIPDEAFAKITDLKRCPTSATNCEKQSGAHQPGRQHYWTKCAQNMGLVDTSDGIRFALDVTRHDPERLFDDRATENCDVDLELETYVPSHNKPKRARITYDHDLTLDTPQRATPDQDTSNLDRRVPTVSPNPDSESKVRRSLIYNKTQVLSSFILPNDLVSMEDIDLVPDYLLIAMGQLKPCMLEEWDKVGCYRDRPKGFRGMCCRHCSGESGHGKFFPAHVGGLAQTTTAQTILKHVAFKCPSCPEDVREAVMKFQEDHAPVKGGPKYGSKKVFFQRIWDRLHNLHDDHISTSIKKASPKAIRKSKSRSSVSSSPFTDRTWPRSTTISDDDSAMDLNISVTM